MSGDSPKMYAVRVDETYVLAALAGVPTAGKIAKL